MGTDGVGIPDSGRHAQAVARDTGRQAANDNGAATSDSELLPAQFRLRAIPVDTVLNRIGGKAVEKKYIAVLQALIRAAPEPLSTSQLLDTVWRDLVVGDNVVHQAIAQLRRSLGDSRRNPAFIETVPRVGYRLIAPISIGEPTPETPSFPNPRLIAVGALAAAAFVLWLAFAQSESRVEDPRTTVAVLQISDLSKDRELGWLANGIGVELRHQIANLDEFETLPRALAATMSPDELAERAALVLDGAIRGDGESVEVVLELTDLESEELLWRQVFPGWNNDAWQLQMQIATSVVRYFNAFLIDIAGPADPIAYEYYLRYLEHQWGGNPDEERRLLEAALEADPAWSVGWEWLGYQAQFFASWQRDRSALDVSRQAIQKVRSLSGDPTDASGVEAFLLAYFDSDPAGAEDIYRSWPYSNRIDYIFLMLSSGLCAEAVDALEDFVVENPYHIGGFDNLAMGYACLGDAESAVRAAARTVPLMSPDAFRGTLGLVWGLPRLGRFEEAEALLARFERAASLLDTGSTTHANLLRFRQLLVYEIAVAQQDLQRARTAAEYFVDAQDHVRAGIMLLRIGDARADWHLLIAASQPLTTGRIWAWFRPFVPEVLREHPSIRHFEDQMGFTLGWRAEMCRRAASAPRRFKMSCNPADYAVPDTSG